MTFTKLVKMVVPRALLDAMRPLNNQLRSIARFTRRMLIKRSTVADLNADLASIGIKSGDTLMVHSSLASIGNVDNGAATIIQSFIQTVGPKGTIMMPAYGSAEEIQAKMEKEVFVDLRTLRSKMGKITEVFRTWPEVTRSSHPFSSVCVWGQDSETIIQKHALKPFICHDQSPMAYIINNNVKIVGLGVSIAVGMAVSHYLEDTYDRFPVEVHAPPFKVTYTDGKGILVSREVIRYDPATSATRIGSPNTEWICDMLTLHFRKLGIMKMFQFGRAKSWVMEAQPVYHELKRLADKGITIYLTKEKWMAMNNGEASIDSW